MLTLDPTLRRNCVIERKNDGFHPYPEENLFEVKEKKTG